MPAALRPLSTGELLDQTFALYRSRFGLFVGIAALPYAFYLVFQMVMLSVKMQKDPAFVFLTIFLGLGAAIASLCVAAATQAATIIAVSNVYLDRPAAVLDSYSRIAFLIPRIVFLSILIGLGVSVGIILLIVPGLIFMTMWAIAVPVAVLENKGISESMSRSSDLTKGNRWRFFLILILFAAIAIVVSLALNAGIGLIAGVSANLPSAPMWVQALAAIAQFITSSLIGPLGTIALSLAYYDERVRKEAFDLELMMAAIDAHQPGLAPAT